MSLLLAPYNNAMRLGQGFNSYSQQICIDDAVVVDPNRAENVVTNDGTTMRIIAQKTAAPSAWTRQKEVINELPATAVLEANVEKAKAEARLIEEKSAVEDVEEEQPESEAESEPEVAGKGPTTQSSKNTTAERESQDQPDDEPEEVQEETESADDLPDADDARKEVDAPVEQEEKAAKAQSSVTKAKPESDEPEDVSVKPALNTDKKVKARESRGRLFSSIVRKATDKASNPSKLYRPASTANLRANDPQTTSSVVSNDDVDRDEIAANLRANAHDGDNDEVDREEVISNLQANSEKPKKLDRVASIADFRAKAMRPFKRGVSADRARQSRAETPAGPPDRAQTRAALLKTKTPTDAARSAKEEAEAARREKEEQELLAEHRAERKRLEQEAREDERARRAEEREEQRAVRAEQRRWTAKRREEARKAIENAADLKATSLQELNKIREQNQFVDRFNGMSDQNHKYDFDPTAPRGPSQTVTYTSRFVDRLSDVLDDMSVSGSLSIKAGKIGGSGKGSFVDSDKFKESDLNFYISVKVVNQTINFKDALVYNPVRSVDKDNFLEVYGDSFISGFVEGGEFNALVSMKILNKARKTDIQAEAKIALTAGPVDIEAQANVGVARSNIETNTETTIQVSWAGGGHIKPMEQQWDIQSLMAAAARFPDLVADCPQRTYAILTKYDTLRSFVARRPEKYTPLQYENAQIYTNALLDSFVSYKALYKRLGEQIFQVQGKTMEIQKWSDSEQDTIPTTSTEVSKPALKKSKDGMYPYQEVTTRFEASLKGLSDARTAIRRQMARIVNEVSLIEREPKVATDEDHSEPFQAPITFEARVPSVEIPARLRVTSHPLSGKKMMAEDDKFAEGTPLFTQSEALTENEKNAMQALVTNNPLLGEDFRVSSAAGDEAPGKAFNNLDYLKKDWSIRFVKTEMADGALVYLAVSYENGLLVEKGASRDNSRVKKFGPFLPGERINSGSIEHGKQVDNPKAQVLGLRLFTNRGRGLIAGALHSERTADKIVIRDGVRYEQVSMLYLDVPFQSGSIKGFFGNSDDAPKVGKILRLGLVWCRNSETSTSAAEEQPEDSRDVIDEEDLALLRKNYTTSNQTLDETRTKLADTQKQLETVQKALDERNKKVVQSIQAQSGRVWGADKGWVSGPNKIVDEPQNFPVSHSSTPKMIAGLYWIDCSNTPAVSVRVQDVSPTRFIPEMSTFNGCAGYGIGCSWMTLPDDLHLESGSVHAYSSGLKTFPRFSQTVVFNQRFSSPPKVCVWLQELDMSSGNSSTCLNVYPVQGITATSFTLNIDSWDHNEFRSVRAGWFAYPAEEDGNRVRSGTARVEGTDRLVKTEISRQSNQKAFSREPATFAGISMINFGKQAGVRMKFELKAMGTDKLSLEYGTWADSAMGSADIVWIALE